MCIMFKASFVVARKAIRDDNLGYLQHILSFLNPKENALRQLLLFACEHTATQCMTFLMQKTPLTAECIMTFAKVGNLTDLKTHITKLTQQQQLDCANIAAVHKQDQVVLWCVKNILFYDIGKKLFYNCCTHCSSDTLISIAKNIHWPYTSLSILLSTNRLHEVVPYFPQHFEFPIWKEISPITLQTLHAYSQLVNSVKIDIAYMFECKHFQCMFDFIDEYDIDLSEEWTNARRYGPYQVVFQNFDFNSIMKRWSIKICQGSTSGSIEEFTTQNTELLVKLIKFALRYRWTFEAKRMCVQVLSLPKVQMSALIDTLLTYCEYFTRESIRPTSSLLYNSDRLEILPRVLHTLFDSKIDKETLISLIKEGRSACSLLQKAKDTGCEYEWKNEFLVYAPNLDMARFCVRFFHVQPNACKGVEYKIGETICSQLIMFLMKYGVEIDVDELIEGLKKHIQVTPEFTRVDLSNRAFRKFLHTIDLDKEAPHVYRALCEVDAFENEVQSLLCTKMDKKIVEQVMLYYLQCDKRWNNVYNDY